MRRILLLSSLLTLFSVPASWAAGEYGTAPESEEDSMDANTTMNGRMEEQSFDEKRAMEDEKMEDEKHMEPAPTSEEKSDDMKKQSED